MTTTTITRSQLEEWLYHEAELLDDHRYEDWLELLTDDIVYRAPMRLTARKNHQQVDDSLCLFEENIHSLRLRVQRLGTDVAWAEDPPSRTRRIVGNVRLAQDAFSGDIVVRSNLLLYRNRNDDWQHDLLGAERTDTFRLVDDELRLAARSALLDQVVVGTKNLGIFL